MTQERKLLDLGAIRERLAGVRGREYWRSLEELAETEEFRRLLHREFPSQASEWQDPVGRREFLRLMAASLALAGVTSCVRQPEEKIVPYVQQPEQVIPGKPLFFATAASLGGYAMGLLVESHMGRPTKVEGNPRHPASLGATDVFSQASVLSLYDPDRSQVISFAGDISTWNEFLSALNVQLERQKLAGGAGMRVLTETVASPSLADHLKQLLAEFPAAKWHQYEPINRDQIREGAQLAFGDHLDTIYRFDRAKIVLSLDADFLSCTPANLRYARDFAETRRVESENAEISRLYVVESALTTTGAVADHRLPLRSTDIETFTILLAQELGMAGFSESSVSADFRKKIHPRWLSTLAGDLRQNRGSTIILAGDHQPASLHALVHAINRALGNAGQTVLHIAPVEANPVIQTESLRELVRDMDAGRVEFLVIIGGNPVYTAPVDLHFERSLRQVRFRIRLGEYYDETSELCQWHVSQAHYLESWGDARAYDGTVTITQPLIAPLYEGKTVYELLGAIRQKPISAYAAVRDYWRAQRGQDFERFWNTALHDGIIPESASLPRPGAAREPRASARGRQPLPDGRAARLGRGQGSESESIEIVFRPDPTVYDGRFSNNGWLQELPKPITKLTWDNAALISPRTAERLGVSNDEVVELRYKGRLLKIPVLIMPGHADGSVTVTLGNGRKRAGRVGTGTGFNAYSIRTSQAPWLDVGVEIRPTGGRYRLISTQNHQVIDGRNYIRSASVEEFRRDPHFAHREEPIPDHSLYPEYKYEGYAWGMAIDLNTCVGCNACIVACQAENNIPVVGKEQVAKNREMHWLRIDTYFHGDLDNPKTDFQAVLCMHCEKAPCEVVCPVAATTHSDEGLNEMTYNRCVGTRYCSNNCPYKVRRFNFLSFTSGYEPSLNLLQNPDVTVRSRGVMEKCTYCVQRINAARIEAKKEDRQIRDGEIKTACQAACPTSAIVFGDINDRRSRVARLKALPLNYALLAELGTQPRTTYLAKVRNPHPEIQKIEEETARLVQLKS